VATTSISEKSSVNAMIPLGGTDYPSSPLDEVAAPVSVHKVQASRANGWGEPPRRKLKLRNNNKGIRELPDVARARFGLGGRCCLLFPGNPNRRHLISA
jgi:hypothetical protein